MHTAENADLPIIPCN